MAIVTPRAIDARIVSSFSAMESPITSMTDAIVKVSVFSYSSLISFTIRLKDTPVRIPKTIEPKISQTGIKIADQIGDCPVPVRSTAILEAKP